MMKISTLVILSLLVLVPFGIRQTHRTSAATAPFTITSIGSGTSILHYIKSYTITWETNDPTISTITIQLYLNGTYYSATSYLPSNIANINQTTISIAAYGTNPPPPEGYGYQFKLLNANDNSQFVFSDYFTIIPHYAEINTPIAEGSVYSSIPDIYVSAFTGAANCLALYNNSDLIQKSGNCRSGVLDNQLLHLFYSTTNVPDGYSYRLAVVDFDTTKRVSEFTNYFGLLSDASLNINNINATSQTTENQVIPGSKVQITWQSTGGIKALNISTKLQTGALLGRITNITNNGSYFYHLPYNIPYSYIYITLEEDNYQSVNKLSGTRLLKAYLTKDTNNPTFSLAPENRTIEFGTDIQISFNATDVTALNYQLFLNNTSIQSGNWTSNTMTMITITPNITGIYHLSLFIYDGYQNYNNTNFTLMVEDTTPPLIDGQLQYTTQTGASLTLQWTVSDKLLMGYSIFENGTAVNEISFTNMTSVEVNYEINTTYSGTTNYTIFVFDHSGLNSTFTSMVIVTNAVADNSETTISSSATQDQQSNGENPMTSKNNLDWNFISMIGIVLSVFLNRSKRKVIKNNGS